MSRYTNKGYCSFAFQNSYGLYNITSAWMMPIIGENLTETIGKLNNRAYYSRFSRALKQEGGRLISGAIDIEANPLNIANCLHAVLYQYYNNPSSGYSYKFQVGSTDFNDYLAVHPLTIEINKDEAQSFYFRDMQVNQFDLQISNGKIVTANLNLIGRSYFKDTKTSLNYNYVKPFTSFQSSISVNGVGQTDFEDLNISIDNNLEPFYTLQNTNIPLKIKRSDQISVLLSGNMLVQNNSFQAWYTNQSEVSFTLFLQNSDGSILFDFPRVVFDVYQAPTQGAEIYKANFNAEAFYSNTSGTLLNIIATNNFLLYPSLFILDDTIFGKLNQTYNRLG